MSAAPIPNNQLPRTIKPSNPAINPAPTKPCKSKSIKMSVIPAMITCTMVGLFKDTVIIT